MKKNFRVVQINGLRGIMIALFVISCLVAGFIVFPAFLTMNVWNYLSVTTASFPLINMYEGALLWAIIVFSTYIFTKRKFIVSFNSEKELTDEEVSQVVAKIKSHTLNNQILHAKDSNEFDKPEINKEHIESENLEVK